MSRTKRNSRIAMLSPLAFALAFGAYAGSTNVSREPRISASAREVSQIRPEDEEDAGWLMEWLERHGEA